jgi:hypothetical protein
MIKENRAVLGESVHVWRGGSRVAVAGEPVRSGSIEEDQHHVARVVAASEQEAREQERKEEGSDRSGTSGGSGHGFRCISH